MGYRLTSVVSMDSPRPSWRIVREWDEIIADTLNLRLKSETRLTRYLKFNIIDRFGLASLLNRLKFKSRNLAIKFVMTASTKPSIFVDKNTIPVIIDYWLEDSALPEFYMAYKDCPLVLVTNKEVYNLLKSKNCPLPVEHWALSYPDFYKQEIDPSEKEYDFCVFGRPNPFFLRLLDKYCEEYPDFEYITNNGNIDRREYVTNKGKFIAKDTGRQSYVDMIRKTRISCYTTPGCDESKHETGRFNQVTPRLFEMLCNGCSVIGHYPMSADVQWYGINDIVPNVNSYEEFRETLNALRVKPVDFDLIFTFMDKHYTSVRAGQLGSLLAAHDIIL